MTPSLYQEWDVVKKSVIYSAFLLEKGRDLGYN